MEMVTYEELRDQIASVLEEWPLYRRFSYVGENVGLVETLPGTISRFCEKCEKELTWSIESKPINARSFHQKVSYQCRNCKANMVWFFYSWYCDTLKSQGFFTKLGQHPAIEERINPVLQKQLQGEDLDFYQKSLRCRNFNYGLAAVAYLRRVVENKMNALLDLIAEVVRESGVESKGLSEIESIKSSRRFDDKVTYAAKILPEYLRPGGQKPIDALHDIASEGIHGKSDSECIDIFDNSRLVFEYLFKQLEVSKEEAEAFVSSLNEIRQRKS